MFILSIVMQKCLIENFLNHLMKKKIFIVVLVILLLSLLLVEYQKGEVIGTWGRNRTINWEWDWRNLWPF